MSIDYRIVWSASPVPTSLCTLSSFPEFKFYQIVLFYQLLFNPPFFLFCLFIYWDFGLCILMTLSVRVGWIYIYIYFLGFRVYSCLGTFILAEKIHEYQSHTFKTRRNNSNICFTHFLFISYSYFFLACWDRRRCLFLECPSCFLVFNCSCSAKEEKEKEKKKKNKKVLL